MDNIFSDTKKQDQATAVAVETGKQAGLTDSIPPVTKPTGAQSEAALAAYEHRLGEMPDKNGKYATNE